ncbi:radical SAM/SPASM domain-containing protein [Clostridium beijerinckii]|uniref:radical SAM/SPASM domain-containing protein n=1 Tax=Clostridium beijerinckii TaxID=1520 RepID=UPI001A9A8E18|nr:radical SAM protein [Clostridium beijerinckii]
MKIENPFKDIYEKCNNGDAFEKIEKLNEFPQIIDLELTNTCNFKCLFCPTGTKSIQREQGIMKDEIFYKIIDEVKAYNAAIRFIRWGEPLIHPKLLEYIKYIKRVSSSIVHINTNGSLLNDNMINEFISIPLDSIKFSFQGVDKKSYEEMRNIKFYDELLNKVRKLYSKRNNRDKPFIHVSTSITYETKEQVKKFKNELEDFTDLITIGRTIMDHVDIEKIKLSKSEKNSLLRLKEQESVVKIHPQICPEVYNKLSINWDGTVTACCSDYDGKMIVGDVRTQSLREIWRSDKMNYYRKNLAQNKFNKFELCSKCYDYSGLQKKGIQKV